MAEDSGETDAFSEALGKTALVTGIGAAAC